MRLEIDIAEHHYNNIMALDSVSLGRAPYKGIIMYSINAIKHGKVLEQEPTTENDSDVQKAIEIIKADSLASYSIDDVLKARDLAVEALKQMTTTKNNIGAQMTNGEKMISAFPNGEVRKCEKGVVFSTGGWCHAYAEEWWNAEYKEPTTKDDCEHCAKTYGTLGCCDYVNNEPIYSCKEGHEEYARGIRKLGTTTKNDLGVDCISRQEVLYLIADNDLSMGQVVRGIHALPSITPQPCEDAVSRQAVLDEAFEVDTKEYGRIFVVGEDHISSLPPVTPQEPKKGEWIKQNDDYYDWYECSECGYGSEGEMQFSSEYDVRTNYCPNCGAKMESEAKR